MTDTDWAKLFDDTFRTPASQVSNEVWAEVMGDDYPSGLDIYSYTTRSELERIADSLQVEGGDTLLDLGCGRGGPGLWVATRTGANLHGVDIAESATQAAQQRAEQLGLADRATYAVGTFEQTGLPDESIDGVMSVDAFLFTPDKPAAFRELARVLRPGRRLVLTSWDYHSQPVARPPQLDDHRPLAEAAGFAVVSYDETPEWRRLQTETTQGLLDRCAEAAAEEGITTEEMQAGLEEMAATMQCMSRRILLVAERR